MTPKEATMKKNEFKARSNIDMQSVSKRKYPELPVGDKVKIYRKKDKLDKERVSVWLPTLPHNKGKENTIRTKTFCIGGNG